MWSSATLATVVAALELGALFQGTAWVAPVLLPALAGSVLGWAARRARVPAAPAVAGAIALLGILALVLAFPSATLSGLPSAATVRHVASHLSNLAVDVHTALPAPPLPDLLALASFAAGLAGLWGGAAAARPGRGLWSLAPSLALVLFTTVDLGRAAGPRAAALAAYLGAALLAVLARESERRVSAGRRDGRGDAGSGAAGDIVVHAVREPGGRRRRPAVPHPRRRALPRGAAIGAGGLGALALSAGLLAGPLLPGAQAAPVVDLSKVAAAAGVSVSPLVDLRTHLMEPRPTPLFSVQTGRPGYWVMVTLDHFSGTTWTGTTVPAPGGGPGAGSPGRGSTVTDVFHIQHLVEPWLPLPSRTLAVVTGGGARLVADRSPGPARPGLTYTAVTAPPRATPSQLWGAKVPANAPRQDLTLPQIPEAVRHLAESITAGWRTPYGKALAIQQYLRTHERYSLDVPAGTGDNALYRFLFVTHAGYCQQFAGSFAVMARAVGLPTRLAVGFTPGTRSSAGTYEVTAADAHTWPEVLLAPYGWVRFEPTPGRAAPAATGPAAASSTAAATRAAAWPLRLPLPDAALAVALGALAWGWRRRWARRRRRERALELQEAGFQEVERREPGYREDGLPEEAPPERRADRKEQAPAAPAPAQGRAPRDRQRRLVLAAWEQAVASTSLADAPYRSHETFEEHARRVGPLLQPGAAEALAWLARAAGSAQWSPRPPTPGMVERAREAAAAVGGVAAGSPGGSHDRSPAGSAGRRRP